MTDDTEHPQTCAHCRAGEPFDHTFELDDDTQEWVDRFLQGYCHALLWADTRPLSDTEGTGGDVHAEDWQTPGPLWAFHAFDTESRAKIREDVDDFIAHNFDAMAHLDAGQCGHDFLLTRNGHGAGFWDRGLGDLGDRLTAACKPYGSTGAWFDDTDDAEDTDVHLD